MTAIVFLTQRWNPPTPQVNAPYQWVGERFILCPTDDPFQISTDIFGKDWGFENASWLAFAAIESGGKWGFAPEANCGFTDGFTPAMSMADALNRYQVEILGVAAERLARWEEAQTATKQAVAGFLAKNPHPGYKPVGRRTMVGGGDEGAFAAVNVDLIIFEDRDGNRVESEANLADPTEWAKQMLRAAKK